MTTESTLRAALQAAKEFARENLRECSADIVTWQDTGLLPDRKLRQLGELCKPLEQNSYMRVAESLVTRAALDAVLSAHPARASQGELSDEQIDAIQRDYIRNYVPEGNGPRAFARAVIAADRAARPESVDARRLDAMQALLIAARGRGTEWVSFDTDKPIRDQIDTAIAKGAES